MEEVFELGLIKDDDIAVDNRDLIIVRHFEGNFSGKWLKTFAVKLPGSAAFECGRSGDALGDVEDLSAACATGVSETGDDTLDFFELIDVVAHGVDVAVFVLNEMDKGLGTADIAKLGTVNDFVFAVGLFVFAAFETFVGFFDDVAGGFLHKEGLDAGGELVGIADAIRGVIFIKEEKLDGDVVFDFVDLVGPMKDVERARWS